MPQKDLICSLVFVTIHSKKTITWFVVLDLDSLMVYKILTTVEPDLMTNSIKQPPLHKDHSQVHPSNIW